MRISGFGWNWSYLSSSRHARKIASGHEQNQLEGRCAGPAFSAKYACLRWESAHGQLPNLARDYPDEGVRAYGSMVGRAGTTSAEVVTFVSILSRRRQTKILARRTIKMEVCIMSSAAKSFEAARRSTRIRAQIPFRLASLDPAVPFSEHCHTLVVNTAGCGVRLNRPLEPGLPVLLDELPGGMSAPARVANCVPLGTEGKYWLAGLALEQPGNIWCIQPAPADWGSESNAPAAAVSLPKKEGEWPYSIFSSKGEARPGKR